MQWWGALTKQFTQLAARAMKDSAGDAAKSLAGTMVKQSFDAAEQTLKKAAATAPAKTAAAQCATTQAGAAAKRRARPQAVGSRARPLRARVARRRPGAA